jgi:hypothetical protein
VNYDGLSPPTRYTRSRRGERREGVSRPLALEFAEGPEMINHLSGSLRGGTRQNVPSAVGGEYLSAMGLGSLNLKGKSVLVKFDDDLPRERDSNLIRFPVPAPLNEAPI